MGHCSICKANGVNSSTCPFNPNVKNPKPRKHLSQLSQVGGGAINDIVKEYRTRKPNWWRGSEGQVLEWIGEGNKVQIDGIDHRTGDRISKKVSGDMVLPFIEKFFSKHSDYKGTPAIGFSVVDGVGILDLEQENLPDGNELEFE